MTKREKLLEVSKAWLGKDASPFDYANDELGCAESVTSLLRRVYRDFPLELATWRIYKLLRADERFKATLNLVEGNIILSPTGYGNGKVRGHVGIIGKDVIMSSASSTGLWSENYTIDSWVKRFRGEGKLPIYVFEPLGIYTEDTKDLEELQAQINEAKTLVGRLQALLSRLLTRKV